MYVLGHMYMLICTYICKVVVSVYSTIDAQLGGAGHVVAGYRYGYGYGTRARVWVVWVDTATEDMPGGSSSNPASLCMCWHGTSTDGLSCAAAIDIHCPLCLSPWIVHSSPAPILQL